MINTIHSQPETRRLSVAARPLHVTIVDEELPYPLTSGKRIRTLNLLKRLSRRHRLTYLCHRNQDAAEARRATQHLNDLGIRTNVVDRPVQVKSGLGFYLRLAANLCSSLPYSVASHTSSALRRAIVEHAQTAPVDLWHCEWTPYAESLRGIVSEPRLVMAHNVESLIWRRYGETETNRFKRWYIRGQWHKFAQFERQVLNEVEKTVAVSDLDASRFHDDFGVRNVEVVENGVDTTYFRPEAIQRDPKRLLFLGSLDWRPNLDGVRQLLQHVFPAVRQRCPRATLSLVGRNPPEELRRLAASTSGVELFADVPDVRPHLARCGLMVVPLRIGGGSRLKILEALATATPVVSTRVGAEGLALESGEHLSMVEGIPELASAILADIENHDEARARAERGRAKVLELYDWDILAEKLERIWIDCIAAS